MEAVADKKTVQDYLQLEEGAPYQLLNGRLVMSPAPKRIHQKITGLLFRLIGNHLEKTELGEVYIAPFDVYLDEENVAQPDISFFATNRLQHLSDRGAEAAPDVAIEVLSASNAYYDLRYKLDLYERFGVKEYFIIDPADNAVMAYSLVDGRYKEVYREKALLHSALLGISLKW